MTNDLKNKIIEKIKESRISMRSKAYFVTRNGVIVLISVVSFLLSAFCFSFVIFSIHEGGEQFLLGFGLLGIITFLKLFPWLLIIVTGILLLSLELILRRFKFSYSMPIINIFLYTLVITILASILLALTPIHINFLKKADMDGLPLIGKMYESIHDSRESDGVIRGSIVSIDGNLIVVSHNDSDIDADDGTWTVVLPAGYDSSMLYVSEKLYIAGKANNGKFYAYGIHELPAERY